MCVCMCVGGKEGTLGLVIASPRETLSEKMVVCMMHSASKSLEEEGIHLSPTSLLSPHLFTHFQLSTSSSISL